MVQVHHAVDDHASGAFADERAAAGALLQADEPGMLERAKRFAQRVARDAELDGQRTLGRQPAADLEAALRKLGADLRGYFLEGAGRPDGFKARQHGRSGVLGALLGCSRHS
ncbi:hypothetical protein D9M68_937510 [compost metagenome]